MRGRGVGTAASSDDVEPAPNSAAGSVVPRDAHRSKHLPLVHSRIVDLEFVADHVRPGATGHADLPADHGHPWRSAVRVPHRRYLGPRVTPGIVDKGA